MREIVRKDEEKADMERGCANDILIYALWFLSKQTWDLSFMWKTCNNMKVSALKYFWTHFWCEISASNFAEHTFDAKFLPQNLLNALFMWNFLTQTYLNKLSPKLNIDSNNSSPISTHCIQTLSLQITVSKYFPDSIGKVFKNKLKRVSHK